MKIQQDSRGHASEIIQLRLDRPKKNALPTNDSPPQNFSPAILQKNRQ
jgi:hypothetical protein